MVYTDSQYKSRVRILIFSQNWPKMFKNRQNLTKITNIFQKSMYLSLSCILQTCVYSLSNYPYVFLKFSTKNNSKNLLFEPDQCRLEPDRCEIHQSGSKNNAQNVKSCIRGWHWRFFGSRGGTHDFFHFYRNIGRQKWRFLKSGGQKCSFFGFFRRK